MRTVHALVTAAVVSLALIAVSPAVAGVVVLDNATANKIDFTIRQTDGKDRFYAVEGGDVVTVPVAGPVGIAFRSGEQVARYLLPLNSVHYFAEREQKLDLVRWQYEEQGPQGGPAAAEPKTLPANLPVPSDTVVKIPVMILVDNHNPTVQSVWETRLRSRLEAASDIFERYCRVRFEVKAAQTWTAAETAVDFERSLDDFSRVPLTDGARMALGFTGRFQWVPNEKHLGGIRGPFAHHILIRDALARVSESERLEVLVHELGHYLGAVHTPDGASVMRPMLGDRRSHAKSFRIRFDAPNTLVMYLLVEQLRERQINHLIQMSPQRKVPMRNVYAAMAKAMPKDTSAAQYAALLGMPIQAPAVPRPAKGFRSALPQPIGQETLRTE